MADLRYTRIGRRTLRSTAWRRAKLFCGLVFRTAPRGRIGPLTAWRVCATLHPWRAPVYRYVPAEREILR